MHKCYRSIVKNSKEFFDQSQIAYHNTVVRLKSSFMNVFVLESKTVFLLIKGHSVATVREHESIILDS